MAFFRFEGLFTGSRWMMPAYVTTDNAGCIVGLAEHEPDSTKNCEQVDGYVLPGFRNAHSHAFQYAMAGLAESGDSSDDFWSWREKMYEIALKVTPDDLEAIAAMLFAEMIRHGYTHVAEFHYLHHDHNGSCYDDPAEMGHSLVRAAESAGIQITLVPVFYQKGGFNREPASNQRRFICQSIDSYLSLLESSEKVASLAPSARLGSGLHSLRAIDPEIVPHFFNSLPPDLPIHLHIAEQLKEVEDCQHNLGKRPVEWLSEKVQLNNRFHLVHATHLSDFELQLITSHNAHVVLCPSTEGNLGDGIFRLRDFQALNGKWSIGTDSHIGLNPLEELRLLDYGQRLTSHFRRTFNDEDHFGITKWLDSGNQAMGIDDQELKEGGNLNAVVFDACSPLLDHIKENNLLPTIIYSGDTSLFKGTIVNGQWVVRDSRHHKFDAISEQFKKTIRSLNLR